MNCYKCQLVWALVVLALCSSAIGFCALTTSGSTFLIRQWLVHSGSLQVITVQRQKGNLLKGLEWEGVWTQGGRRFSVCDEARAGKVIITGVLQHKTQVRIESGELSLLKGEILLSFNGRYNRDALEISTLKGVLTNTTGSQFRAEKMDVFVDRQDVLRSKVNVIDGRLSLPGADQIFFSGSLNNRAFDLNVFSKWISVSQIVALLKGEKKWGNVSGMIVDINSNISGPIEALKITGNFFAEKVVRDGFELTDAPCRLDWKVKGVHTGLKLYGPLIVKSGELSGPKSAKIAIEESRIDWDGDLGKVRLNLKGHTTVERTKIDIRLKGSLDKPELTLYSSPTMPQDRLLVMLVTNRRWSSADKAVDERKMSVDLAKDLVDYFMFDGMSQKLSQRLGINEIFITMDKTKKGVGIKKSLSQNTDITYAIEQTQDKAGKVSNVQKIGGEYKVTDAFSVGAEREIKAYDRTAPVEQNLPPEEKVLLKYKKEF